MKIIETKVYTFDELSDEAKETARAWYREGNDYPFLSDYMQEEAGELLKKAKIKTDDFKVYYSLSYSQGDGAMIELEGTWKAWNVKVTQSGHYSHERSTTIALSSMKTGEYAPEEKEKDFEENVYIPVCIALKKYGYECIEYENSNESVDETIQANEYTFTEDGTRF